MHKTSTQRSDQTSGTTSTMKRICGGYVLRAQSVAPTPASSDTSQNYDSSDKSQDVNSFDYEPRRQQFRCEEDEALSASLDEESVQLRDDFKREGRLNYQVEDLKEKLKTSLTKNVEWQHQLDDALMTHLQDQRMIKTVAKGHEELKVDVARSRRMLE
uniref:AlNc14C549G12125 protein n=1 Tax=Albugo laibachii Nc14 TaxID=890382 RepID=F0X133_9STRA|nr:AlNc14C549G12125 [Albugo laibachii Nc14]|eukprot:CCA27487.1 AlNc14C549G12125 [Albugo laibachii Nc14]